MNKSYFGITESLSMQLNKAKSIVAYGVVGSVVSSKKFNDIDILALCTNTKKASEEISNILSNYQLSHVDDAIKINGFCDREISVALYNIKEVEEFVDRFILGQRIIPEHRSWSIGYWLPEGFIMDLSRIQILNDDSGYLEVLKNRVQSYSPYARKRILSDCLEEMKLKEYKMNESIDIEKSIIENDIKLCKIRSSFAIKSNYLKSFKNLNELSIKSAQVDKESISKELDWSNDFYLGTWQYSNDFKKLTDEEIIDILKFAKDKGIRKFDTAFVYGKGHVEELLGKVLSDEDMVVTKIPAKIKPEGKNSGNIENYYSAEYIFKCFNVSSHRLHQSQIETVLLHNWIPSWKDTPVLKWLNVLKQEGRVKKVGISLPNGYDEILPEEVLKQIDVIEAPYNTNNRWIEKSLDFYKSYGKEIILRSLFQQGKSLREGSLSHPSLIIQKVKNLGTSLTIGMTTKSQINENIKVLKGVEK